MILKYILLKSVYEIFDEVFFLYSKNKTTKYYFEKLKNLKSKKKIGKIYLNKSTTRRMMNV